MFDLKSVFVLFVLCFFSSISAWRITVCSETELSGSCANLQAEGCMTVGVFDDDTIMSDRIKSINTNSGCIRAFADNYCFGRTRAYYVGSPEWVDHRNLAQTKFDNQISSFGPCYPDECANKGGKNIDNCIFHDDVYFGIQWGDKNKPVTDVNENNNPIIKYQRGYKNRVEYVKTVFRRELLDTGTEPNEEVNAYIRTMGQPNDKVGYIIPKITGGPGTKTYNVFPQNEKVKQGLLYKMVDQMVYDAVKEQSYIEMEVTLHYESDTSTRPDVLLYRFHGIKYYRVRNLINPK